MDDWTLYRQAKRGGEAAWRMLLARHGPRLLDLVALATGSPEAAQDTVQDVFLDLLKHPPRHQQGSLAAYLTTAAWRRAMKQKKRAARVVKLDDSAELPEDERTGPLDGVIKSEQDRHVAASINRLDPDLREVLLLRFYGGLSYGAIAEETDVPLGTVKSRIFRAVRQCRLELERTGWVK